MSELPVFGIVAGRERWRTVQQVTAGQRIVNERMMMELLLLLLLMMQMTVVKMMVVVVVVVVVVRMGGTSRWQIVVVCW